MDSLLMKKVQMKKKKEPKDDFSSKLKHLTMFEKVLSIRTKKKTNCGEDEKPLFLLKQILKDFSKMKNTQDISDEEDSDFRRKR